MGSRYRCRFSDRGNGELTLAPPSPLVPGSSARLCVMSVVSSGANLTDTLRRVLGAKALLAMLLASFLIPVATSSLRGVTHVLECTGANQETFEVFWTKNNKAIITGSAVIEPTNNTGLCTDVDADMALRPGTEGRVLVTVRVRNDRASDVQATVVVDTGSLEVPVRLGTMRAGTTTARQVTIRGGRKVTVVRTRLIVGP
jgi:hypothetical protein